MRALITVATLAFALGTVSGCDSETNERSNLAAHDFMDDMPFESCSGNRADYYRDRWDTCVNKKLYEGHDPGQYCSGWIGCCGVLPNCTVDGRKCQGVIGGGMLFMVGDDNGKSKCEAAGCKYHQFSVDCVTQADCPYGACEGFCEMMTGPDCM